MTRRTRKDVDSLLAVINRYMEGKAVYGIDSPYGKVRLFRIEGAGERNISPLLSVGQLCDWLHAFIQGIEEFSR